MKFGVSAKEAKEAPSRAGGGGGFMKRPVQGDNIWRIADEPDKWVYFYEHFNPDGYSFPCPDDEESRAECPGCLSDNQKMKKVAAKVAFNVYDGEYTNVVKVPRASVADKLEARYERIGTLKDRDYLIRQIKKSSGVEYDVEGLEKEEFDFSEIEDYLADTEAIQQMLADAYEESWGTSGKAGGSSAEPKTSGRGAAAKKAAAKKAPSRIQRSEPKEEKVVTEDELRKMDVFDLARLCEDEGYGKIPKNLDTADEIVDWMLEQS